MTYRQEPGFDVAVIIEDVRKAFGRIDYQIRPVTGAGIKWVSSDRISEDNARHERRKKMITVDTEKAMIHGENGSTHYSIMDGSIDIYDPQELTDEECCEAVAELEKMIEDGE